MDRRAVRGHNKHSRLMRKIFEEIATGTATQKQVNKLNKKTRKIKKQI